VKLVIDATEEELREKGPELLKAVLDRLSPFVPEAGRLRKALDVPRPRVMVRPRKTQGVLRKATQPIPPSDNPPPPRYQNVGPTLSMHIGAATSQAGNRAVHSGAGVNILVGSKPAPHAGSSIGMDFLAAFIDSQEGARESQRKKIAKTKLEAPLPRSTDHLVVHPYEPYKARAEMSESILEEAPERRKHLERLVVRRHMTRPAVPGITQIEGNSTAEDQSGQGLIV